MQKAGFLTTTLIYNFINVTRINACKDSFIILLRKYLGDACLVINPNTVNNFSAPFNCTPADRASDSLMVLTLTYSFELVENGARLSVAWSTGAQLVIFA